MGKVIWRLDDGTEYEIPTGWQPPLPPRKGDVALVATIAEGLANVTIRLHDDGTWEVEKFGAGAFVREEWSLTGDQYSRVPPRPATEAQRQAIQDWLEMPERAPFRVAKVSNTVGVWAGQPSRFRRG
jgi:hypothetical protein